MLPDLRKRVAVIQGGPSPEAAVSRLSAAGVRDALAETYEHVLLVELDERLPEALLSESIDVAFPVTHGVPGEDGTLQGMLEILGIPYVGSGVLASACAMAKHVAKTIFTASELRVPRGVVIGKDAEIVSGVDEAIQLLGVRTVVKPANCGSGLGVVFSRSPDELAAALSNVLAENEQALIEEWLEGKEITVGVLERGGTPEALPVIEIVTPADSWYDYEHRYTPGLSKHLIPAQLSAETLSGIQNMAVRAHTALGCRDFSRADFVVPENGAPTLLEVNTLPGFTATSLYPDAASAAGLSFPELVATLVAMASKRQGPNPPYMRPPARS